MKRHGHSILTSVMLVGGLLTSNAAIAADASARDPDLEAAMRRFGTVAQSSQAPALMPTSPTVTTTPASPAAGRLQPELAGVLLDEPALDAAAMAALGRENLRKVGGETTRGLAGYEPDALPNRLRASQAAVDALLRRLPAASVPPTAPTQ